MMEISENCQCLFLKCQDMALKCQENVNCQESIMKETENIYILKNKNELIKKLRSEYFDLIT